MSKRASDQHLLLVIPYLTKKEGLLLSALLAVPLGRTLSTLKFLKACLLRELS